MDSQQTASKLLLTAREAAAALSVSERTLWALSHSSGEITPIRIGRSVRYPVTALSAWVARKQAEAAGGRPGPGGGRMNAGEALRTGDAARWERLWASIEPVMAREDAGPAVKLCYLRLWILAGARAGTVAVTPKRLAADMSVSDRGGRRWLRDLERLKWIRILEQSPAGAVALYVEAPADLDRPRRFGAARNPAAAR